MTDADAFSPLSPENQATLQDLRDQFERLTRLLTPEDQPAGYYSPHVRLLDAVEATQ